MIPQRGEAKIWWISILRFCPVIRQAILRHALCGTFAGQDQENG